ncbi:MAG: hypothetical protein PHQ63_06415 [Smithellaceae bacterium]|nr:hypothetical protein [Smithellaceae bacterium]
MPNETGIPAAGTGAAPTAGDQSGANQQPPAQTGAGADAGNGGFAITPDAFDANEVVDLGDGKTAKWSDLIEAGKKNLAAAAQAAGQPPAGAEAGAGGHGSDPNAPYANPAVQAQMATMKAVFDLAAKSAVQNYPKATVNEIRLYMQADPKASFEKIEEYAKKIHEQKIKDIDAGVQEYLNAKAKEAAGGPLLSTNGTPSPAGGADTNEDLDSPSLGDKIKGYFKRK